MSYLVPAALLAVAFVAALFGSYGDVLKESVKHQPATEYVLRLRVRGARYDHFGTIIFVVSLLGALVTSGIALATR